jgi:hypothetical protein
MAHLGGLPHLGTLRRTEVRLRSTRYDIPFHLHLYAPLLSSTHTEIVLSLRAVNFGILGKVQLNHGRPRADLKSTRLRRNIVTSCSHQRL